jgi:hypothetical protein
VWGGKHLRQRIGDYLIKIKAMTPVQVAAVLEKQDSGDNRRFAEIAADLGYLKRDALRLHFSTARPCCFSPYCHFYGIRKMTAGQQTLKNTFCLQSPPRCAIFQHRQAGKPYSRTLWPESWQ